MLSHRFPGKPEIFQVTPGSKGVSDNLTPDSTGKPDGLTLEQFKIVLRTGHDVLTKGHPTLAVMPWPYYRNMTDQPTP